MFVFYAFLSLHPPPPPHPPKKQNKTKKQTNLYVIIIPVSCISFGFVHTIIPPFHPFFLFPLPLFFDSDLLSSICILYSCGHLSESFLSPLTPVSIGSEAAISGLPLTLCIIILGKNRHVQVGREDRVLQPTRYVTGHLILS